MANIVEYIQFYKDKTFDEVPLNDVDALILAEFSYIELNSFLTEEKMPITIEELGKIYFKKVTKESMKNRHLLYRETYHLFEVMKDTKRYKNLLITNYKNIVDEEKQFGAITFRNERKWTYVAFEGTDTSIIGWKEDFDMSHVFPVPSQQLAIDYLEGEVRFFDKSIYVGGHSKGGNLALVACMKCSSFVRNRLKTIYNFDGPGVRDELFHSHAYERIKRKMKMFVPEQSVVGMILSHATDYKVVVSSSKGLFQHDGMSWQCFGSFFVETTLSQKSKNFQKEMRAFLKEIPDSERAEFVNSIFLVLSKAGITSTERVTFSKILRATAYIGDLRANQKTKEKLKKIFVILKNYLR